MQVLSDHAEISLLTREGRFCVVEEHPVYCKSTDATLTPLTVLVEDFGTRSEAVDFARQRVVAPDVRIYVTPGATPFVAPTLDKTDDVPF